MKKAKRFLPIIIIIAAIAAFVIMTKLKKAPPSTDVAKTVQKVSVLSFSKQVHTVHMNATGTVRSETAVTLLPEVSGKVVFISKKMNRGGYFRKGDLLFKIDDREYALQVESSKAAVDQQEVRYQTEVAQSNIAKDEWEEFHKNNPNAEAGTLTLREPQLKMEQANLDAAKARLKLSELHLDKTKMYAPFTGRVIERRVGKGQFVAPGAALATIISTEKIEIALPLSVREAALIAVDKKPEADIFILGKEKPLKGKVERIAAQLDARSRMIDLIVGLSQAKNASAKNSLLIDGSFVSVTIAGRELKDVFVIPRWLFHGEELWLDDDGILKILKPHILAHEKKNLIIGSERLPATISVVSSMLSIASNGIKLQVAK